MAILRKLFVIFIIFIFPLGEVARFQNGNGVAITAIDVGVFLLVICWFLLLLKKKITLQSPFKKEIGLFLGVCLLSLALNLFVYSPVQVFVGFLYILRWAAYCGVYFFVASIGKDKRFIFKSLTFSGIVITLLGFAQYVFYPALRNLYYAGWDEHLYRIFSTFLDPNFAGAFFVLFFLFLLGFFFINFSEKKYMQTAVYGALGIMTLLALFLTYSRGAYISLIVGVICLLVFLRKKGEIIFLLTVIVCIGILSLTVFHKQSEGTNLLRTVSTKERFHNARDALFVFSKSPFFGVGFNTYRYAQRKAGILKDGLWEAGHGSAGADTSLLFVLATTGIIGLVIYLNLLRKIAFSLFEKFQKQKILSGIVLASLIALFVNSFFINALFYPSLMVWLWILLGLIENT